MKHTPKKISNRLVIPAACAVIVLAVLIFALTRPSGPDLSGEIATGISYLESLEQKDPAAVQEVRKEIRRQELEEQREELLTQLTDGTIDPFSLFKDFTLLGDSRAMGFWFWEFMDKERVLADGGHTIRYIKGYDEELAERNPSYVFLCYGLNDISMGFWETGEEFAAEYMEKVDWVLEQAPNATVIVSSILPAMDPAFSVDASWYNIPEWNVALEAACKEHGVLYADCSRLAENYAELWDVDGIHFEAAFYPYWASILITTALMGGEEVE